MLKLISPVSFYCFIVAARKLSIPCVARIPFPLHSAILGAPLSFSYWTKLFPASGRALQPSSHSSSHHPLSVTSLAPCLIPPPPYISLSALGPAPGSRLTGKGTQSVRGPGGGKDGNWYICTLSSAWIRGKGSSARGLHLLLARV